MGGEGKKIAATFPRNGESMNSEQGILRKKTDRFPQGASLNQISLEISSGLIVKGQNGSTLMTDYKRVD